MFTHTTPSKGTEAAAAQLIRANREQLRIAQSIVSALAELDAPDHVALYSQATAHWGSSRFSGSFVFPSLERCLAAAAQTLPVPDAGAHQNGETARVVHVATAIPFPAGGHGRFISRWVRLDRRRTHTLVVTSPYDVIEPILEQAVVESGGTVHRLAPAGCSLLRRAAELRALVSTADVIVLHVHDYDVVAAMALEWAGRPPTIRVNHNGHLPWLGCRVADVVACGRDSAVDICVARRGIPRRACLILPLAVERAAGDVSVEREAARERTRAELGIREQALALLTVASPYKLRPIGSADLRTHVAATLARRPHDQWLVVGPASGGEWQEIEEQSGGQVRCLGVRDDVSALLAAADVYLDSWPFTSQTSLVDAAVHGLPILAARWHPPAAAVLGAWGGAVSDAIIGFDDAESFARVLEQLTHLNARRQAGEMARRAAAEAAASWPKSLEELYRQALERAPRRHDEEWQAPAESDSVEPTSLDLLLAQLNRGNEPWRAFVNWHRDMTNRGSETSFPADEARLAETSGLAALIGQLELTIRDFEACVASLGRTATESTSAP